MIANSPTYLIAKYIPDISRMEPKNIGVILWSNGATAARFLPAPDADFVSDTELYNRWVNFWTKQITQDVIHPYRSRPVRRTNPKFLDGLKRSQDGHFGLQEGGFIVESVAANDVQDAADFLFGKLVAPGSAGMTLGEPQETFRVVCDRIVDAAGLEFTNGYSVPLEVRGVTQHCNFDYALAQEENLRALVLRIKLSELSATSAAYKFGGVIDSKILAEGRCAALVHRSSRQDAEPQGELLSILRSVSVVIETSDEAQAMQQMADFGKKVA